MIYEYQQDQYLISTDPAKLDVEVIHDFLSRSSYWAQNIPRETVVRSLKHSLCFGVYEDARQIGFARVITDRATFAYLADVFIVDDYRGKGLSKWLIRCIMAHPDLQGLRRFNLATHDAHSLYAQYGFKELQHPERHMEKVDEAVYQRTE